MQPTEATVDSVNQLTITGENINTCMKVSHTCPAAAAASAGSTSYCTSSFAENQQNEINKEGYFRNSYCIQLHVAVCPKRGIQLQVSTQSINQSCKRNPDKLPKPATNCQNSLVKTCLTNSMQLFVISNLLPYSFQPSNYQ